jgi:hypothetical protein
MLYLANMKFFLSTLYLYLYCNFSFFLRFYSCLVLHYTQSFYRSLFCCRFLSVASNFRMSMKSYDCLGPTIFGKILDGSIPADFIHQDDLCVAFRDVNPQVI